MRGARAGLAVLLLAAAPAVAGCFADRDEQDRIDAITADIQRELAGHPDVTEVEVAYYDYVTDPDSVKAEIVLRPGADVDPVIAEAARLIWLSQVHPLSSVSVEVSDPQDPTLRQTRIWHVADPQAEDYRELERQFGPRPPPD